MSVYLITYELNGPVQNYDLFFQRLKSFDNNWHHLDAVWLVSSDAASAKEISDKLQVFIESTDAIFVIKVSADYAGWLPEDSWEWLDEHLK